MVIIDYENTVNPGFWLNRLSQCDWTAGQYLYQQLKEGTFHEHYGEKARLLLLTDGTKLVSFCTYAARDDIPDTELTPWMGFVYTAPEYRGRRLMGRLIAEVKALAREDGYDTLWISICGNGKPARRGCRRTGARRTGRWGNAPSPHFWRRISSAAWCTGCRWKRAAITAST